MLEHASHYEELYTKFRWDIPEHFNIDHEVCNRWAAGGIDHQGKDAWLKFVGHDDDVITSAGYRIGPGVAHSGRYWCVRFAAHRDC